MSWQTMESAPKDGTYFLGFWTPNALRSIDGDCYGVARFADGEWIVEDTEVSAPNFWMPLPNPPHEGEAT